MHRSKGHKPLRTTKRPPKRVAKPSLETMERRALLSVSGYPVTAPVSGPVVSAIRKAAGMPVELRGTVGAHTEAAMHSSALASYPWGGGPSPGGTGGHHMRGARHATGVVTKKPHFYEFYTGPRWAELNAVKASGKLSTSGVFVFTGTNRGKINQGPAVYVWGIDRSGNLPAGPFTNRPNIRFDAVVIVSLDTSLTPTASVFDLDSGKFTSLSSSAVSIHGRTVRVTVPENLLPSTGLVPSQFRFNYWPEDGGPPGSSSVASFAPEFITARVGLTR
jgi:hypothetical protein